MVRIGVASIMQETNTWSRATCTLGDFEAHGLHVGPEIAHIYTGTNTEIGGALDRIRRRGAEPVPLLRAWALSSGRLTATTLIHLRDLLVSQLGSAGRLDGLVLCLHGAMAAEGCDDADGALIGAVREISGSDVPLGVCLDLHANVTEAMVDGCDALVGFLTYPHVDQADAGGRAADLILDAVEGKPARTVLSKRAMLLPPESMDTSADPMEKLRLAADGFVGGDIVDVGLFPVQPWLDVSELGLGVTVTTRGDVTTAKRIADKLATEAWESREEFRAELVDPAVALEQARASSIRPFIISESADSPTAGSTGDSPAALAMLLRGGGDLTACLTLVDRSGVEAAFALGRGGRFAQEVGTSLDPRFHDPVRLEGAVDHLGAETLVLEGSCYQGMRVSMGRYAVIRSGGIQVLLTERPALTHDPVTFRHVGIDPDGLDVIVVRSALMYKAAYPQASVAQAVTLDLPGASTPRLELLRFTRAPRPMFPVDQ